MQDFKNLEVWDRAHKLTLLVYGLTEMFPRAELFGLTSQLRRAASSIPTNLAEGCGRTQPEFGRFVQISLGSACEVEYQLLLARDLKFLTVESYEAAGAELISVKRMLTALLKRIQQGTVGAEARVSERAAIRNSLRAKVVS
jgi:four helix bundle protein